jgi:hypothetical protein
MLFPICEGNASSVGKTVFESSLVGKRIIVVKNYALSIFMVSFVISLIFDTIFAHIFSLAFLKTVHELSFISAVFLHKLS